MSIGNLKDQGNKGNNFPYQLRTLQLLAQIDTSINNIPGVDFVTRTTTYQANNNGTGYNTLDIIVRYDIIDIVTSNVVTTIWYNQTQQTTIAPPGPLPADLTPVAPPSAVTVINGPLGAAVAIQDGGNSITVDDGSGSLTVDGTVTANQGGTWVLGANSGVDIGDVTVNNAGGANAVNIQDGGNSITVDGTVNANQAGIWNINNITGTISLPTGAATETTLGSVNTKLTSAARTPNLLRATGSGTIAPQVYSFSVANVGSLNGTILGQTIKPGETLNFDAGALNNYYAAGTITYNGTGTELVIIYNS